MAVTTRALTPPTQRRHALSNINYASNGPSLLLRDQRTFLRGTARTLQFCTDWADIAATGGTPAWTSVATFAESTSYTIAWMHELANGELIACLTRTDITPPNSRLWRSSGWPANPATATWTQVLSSQGGRFDQEYSSHAWASGSNGVMVVAESGAQTSGGAANDAVDQSRATRAFVSIDFGATWVQLFELRAFAAAQGVPYPAGVHLHGIAYDEEWDRIWINYGDDTGDGLKIAGAGYTQTLFSDDRGATWQKLAVPALWSNTNAALGYGQWIAFAFTPAGVILSPDVSRPLGPMLYRRTGYRQIGAAQWLLPCNGVNGRVARLGSGYAVTGSTGRTYGAGTANMPVAISDDGLAWDIVTVPVTTGASGYGPTIGYVLGPTMSGRVVLGLGGASLAGGNGWAVATLG